MHKFSMSLFRCHRACPANADHSTQKSNTRLRMHQDFEVTQYRNQQYTKPVSHHRQDCYDNFLSSFIITVNTLCIKTIQCNSWPVQHNGKEKLMTNKKQNNRYPSTSIITNVHHHRGCVHSSPIHAYSFIQLNKCLNCVT